MEKERFYRGQQSTTRGFMGMALQALSVLTRLAANPAIQARSRQSMCKCNTDSHTLSSCTSTPRYCLFEIFNTFCQDIVHHCNSLEKTLHTCLNPLLGRYRVGHLAGCISAARHSMYCRRPSCGRRWSGVRHMRRWHSLMRWAGRALPACRPA